MLAGVPVSHFIRTPNRERDMEDAKQRQLEKRYRERVDPSFRARDWHVHHSVPLFLGGLDSAPMNLVLVERFAHLRGHDQLAYQPQLAKQKGGRKPPLGGANLYRHPPGTRYRLVGFKKDRNDTCGA
jgi:hypothetical protein